MVCEVHMLAEAASVHELPHRKQTFLGSEGRDTVAVMTGADSSVIHSNVFPRRL